MTYKDKKLKEFEEYFNLLPYPPSYKETRRFLSSTIDEILGCLPAESENKDWDFHEGFNVCRNLFLLKLEQKAGEL